MLFMKELSNRYLMSKLIIDCTAVPPPSDVFEKYAVAKVKMLEHSMYSGTRKI